MHVFFGYPFKLGKSDKEFVSAVCAKRALTLRGADDHFSAESIWDDIQGEIDSASYAIFDLTGYNHNVLLELGYAIGRDRDVIILLNATPPKGGLFSAPVDPMEGFPSDLSAIRRVHYTDRRDLEKKLLETFDNLLRAKHPDEQFWMLLRNFLKDGSQDTKSISTFMEGKLAFSYQMTRNRLERHYRDGRLNKRSYGKASVYELPRSVLQ